MTTRDWLTQTTTERVRELLAQTIAAVDDLDAITDTPVDKRRVDRTEDYLRHAWESLGWLDQEYKA